MILTSKSKSLLLSEVNVNKHVVAMHDKFALGFSCIILFFVGAPLGALIRKGGIGLPLDHCDTHLFNLSLSSGCLPKIVRKIVVWTLFLQHGCPL